MNYNTNGKPILSISFLTNGKKKELHNCLESLVRIMEQLPSELIVVDTGCDEKTVAALREYTDKIVPFTWCNNFAKARNAGVERATGEWFLYIDDDEWFEDAGEIIDFFRSGEYKQYGYANYIARNYYDYEGHSYQDVWVSRLVKLYENTHFESPIHEYFQPVTGKCKFLDCYVNHYGYVFDSEEQKLAHSRRNISLLKEILNKDIDNIRWWTQLAQEYAAEKNYDCLQKLCLKGLKHFDDKNESVINSERGTFYIGLLIVDLKKGNYIEAEKHYKQAYYDKRNTAVCKAMLCVRMAEIYYKGDHFEKCKKCCEEYIQFYDVFNGDEEAIYMQGAFFTYDVCKIDVRNNVYCFYLKCCILHGDVKGFSAYFYKIGLKEEKIHIYHTFISDVLDGFATLPYTDEFVQMAQTMMDRNGINRLTIERLQQIEREDKEKFAALYRIFEQVDSPAIIKNPKPVQQKLTITPEMQQLATQIKGQIQVLLGQGLYKEANAVLAQLKTFVPIDEEMAAMEQQITNNLSSI